MNVQYLELIFIVILLAKVWTSSWPLTWCQFTVDDVFLNSAIIHVMHMPKTFEAALFNECEHIVGFLLTLELSLALWSSKWGWRLVLGSAVEGGKPLFLMWIRWTCFTSLQNGADNASVVCLYFLWPISLLMLHTLLINLDIIVDAIPICLLSSVSNDSVPSTVNTRSVSW